MSVFEKFSRRKAEEPLSTREAVATVLYLMAASDGEISAEEKEQFVAISNRMQLFRKQTTHEFNEMIEKINALLNTGGFDDTLSKAAAIIPPDLRQTAFALAVDLAFADGTIEDSEKDFLDVVQTSLEVSDDLAIKIIEVIQIKNRG